METIGSFEAKTHWSALLERVSLGQEIVITKRGKAIARLIPEIDQDSSDISQVISSIKKLRKRANLKGDGIKSLRDVGRK